MERLQRVFGAMGGGGAGGAGGDTPQVDTAEQVYISSLALLKMLKHGTQTQSRLAGTLLTRSLQDARACLWR